MECLYLIHGKIMNTGILTHSDTLIPGHPTMTSGTISTDSTPDFQSLLSPPSSPLPSFFTTHELKTRDIQPQSFQKYQPDWILALLLTSFILLAWAQVFYRRRLRQIIIAPFSRRFLSQLVRDGDLISERISLATGAIYLLMMSLFIFEGFELLIPKGAARLPEGILLFVIITACVFFFWLLKIGFIRFLAFIFRTRLTTREYILNILIFNIITGIILLPALVFTVYLKSVPLLCICMIIFVFFFSFRFVRGFLIGISLTKFPYVFLFVYLCSLEILPLVVLMKVVMKYFL